MRIAVMAAGAVGGYYGARMAAAGHDVFFIARGANLDAMRKNGLKVESVHGDLHLPKVNVTDDPKSVGPVDIVLFAVKLWDTEEAGERTKPLVGPGTRVITLQNGVDSVDRLNTILPAECVIGGTAAIASTIAAPGLLRQTSSFAAVRFGRADGKADAVLQAFEAAAKAAKLDVAIAPDIGREIWNKFILLAATSGATAALRSTVGPIVADIELRTFMRALMEETCAVGRAKGANLEPDIVDKRMNYVLTNMHATMRASMAVDLERGNRLELDWLSGKVRELGRQYKIPTPASDTVCIVLKLHRMGSAH
ncbi:MAG: ketopantoate reductase family protein [Pseudolabrys sp.]